MLRNYFEFYRNLSTGMIEGILQILGNRTAWIIVIMAAHAVATRFGCLFVGEKREYTKYSWEKRHSSSDRVKYHILGGWYWLAIPFLVINLIATIYAFFPDQPDIIARGVCISLIVHGGAIFISL